MPAREDREELERFSERVVQGRAALQMLGPFERLLQWETLDRAGSSRTVTLRSGLTLSISQVRWEKSWTLAFDPDPSKLKLIVARGPGPRITPAGEPAHDLTGGAAYISRILRPVELRFDFEEAASRQAHEELCVEVDRTQLCQLLGSTQLPAPLERVWSSTRSYPFELLSAPSASFRVLDEILQCDARSAGRQLHLEAKGLELLAAWIDHVEAERDAASELSAHDIQRLEDARSILLARITAPPTLPELARLARLNEGKLKQGFRKHFGDSVFGYLRRQRLEQAHRLLRQGHYNVTEVATRVGYANPSKFAAAFKALFGVSPSDIR